MASERQRQAVPARSRRVPWKKLLAEVADIVADGAAPDWERVRSAISDPRGLALLDQYEAIVKVFETLRARRRMRPMPSPPVVAPRLGQWGGLTLLEEIGGGSYGTVYRAHDPRLDRPVALKLLRPRYSSREELVSDLLHEGQTLAKVSHSNVVKVYRAAIDRGRFGIEMEFVRGLTLEQMLVNHGRFSASEAELVGYQLCGALAAVHRAGLVHRDVKAENVMREEGGRLVLVDFGASQKRAELAMVGGRPVGTPLYLAPEVLKGGPATPASDVYSLGVLLYHLVTDDFPVKAGSLVDLARAHELGEVPPLDKLRTELPRAFIDVVRRAIDPDPAKRFADASRLKASLDHTTGSGRMAAPRIRPPERKAPGARTVGADGDAGLASLAVLPFSDMSPAKDQESFCDGITEELINALAQIPDLRVAARTSTFQFKGRSPDVRRVGEKLNVAAVLDGSVRKSGNQLRIMVDLIGTSDGWHRWSQRFDRETEDVFAVQDEITEAVVTALKGKLTVGPRIVAHTSRRANVEAYDAYLEGRNHWNRRTEGSLKKSVLCFERANRLDPTFAPAFAGLGDAYVTLGTYGAMAPADVMPAARSALEKALELDAGLAEAYTCRACIRSVYDWSWADAEKDFKRAIELNPSYATAHHWYAINYLVPLGRFDEATAALRRALELDPLALVIGTSLGMKSYFAGQYDEAVGELSRTLEIDERFGMARLFLGATYTEQSRYAEAREELDAASLLSGRSPEILAALGYLHGVSGNPKSARRVLAELKRFAATRYVSPAKLAQVHVGLGEHAKALDRLEEAQQERAADVAWLGVRPVFASLRSEPRFAQMAGKIGFNSARRP